MNIRNDIRNALQPLIDAGVIHDIEFPQATYGAGSPQPEEVYVQAIVNAANPNDHRQEIERRLTDAGLTKVIVTLYRRDGSQAED